MAQSSRGRVDRFTQDAQQHQMDIFASVTDSRSLKAAAGQARLLSDSVSANAGPRQLDAMASSEATRSILELIITSRHQDPAQVASEFSKHLGLVTELGLLWNKQDNASAVVRVAMNLMTQRPEQVDAYPALAAAISVVHDQSAGAKFKMRVNENIPVATSPLEIFDFFVNNARTMTISPDKLAAINLVYVVDVTESTEQLQWAHNTYRSNPGINERFHEIVYDRQHFLQGTPKKVTAAGDYSLTQIKKYGGVCADQAYFAMSVAKACGIPSGYVVAKGADVSHAWVGFLKVQGRRAAWNFDAGRFGEYLHLRGNLRNPQSGKPTSDGRVGILGGAMTTNLSMVHHSLAAGMIVDRMNNGRWNAQDSVFDLDSKGNIRKPRSNTPADRLALLKLTLSKCGGVPAAWDKVTDMAKSGDMTKKDLDTWSRAVMQISGKTNQDFSFDFLSDLISGVKDHRQQHEMWDWAFGQFRSRPDLAAATRFEQGKLWEKNNKPDMAWLAYQGVLDNFLNDGPMCIDALASMRQLLASNGKQMEFLTLLEKTARSVNKPADMASNFASQSNYYKINRMLITEFERHNRKQEAKQLRKKLNIDD